MARSVFGAMNDPSERRGRFSTRSGGGVRARRRASSRPSDRHDHASGRRSDGTASRNASWEKEVPRVLREGRERRDAARVRGGAGATTATERREVAAAGPGAGTRTRWRESGAAAGRVARAFVVRFAATFAQQLLRLAFRVLTRLLFERR